MDPIRVHQTDAAGFLVPNVLVFAEYDATLGEYLYPAGTRTQELPVLGPNQTARTTGPSRDDPWEVVPDFNGLTYWMPDGSQHTISALGVEPPEGFLTAPPPPTAQEFQAMVARAVNDKLDALAKSWRYTNYVSARSYIGDTNPKYDLEARAIANYGSACFQVLDELEAEVTSGAATMPASVEDVVSLLPAEPSRPVVGG